MSITIPEGVFEEILKDRYDMPWIEAYGIYGRRFKKQYGLVLAKDFQRQLLKFKRRGQKSVKECYEEFLNDTSIERVMRQSLIGAGRSSKIHSNGIVYAPIDIACLVFNIQYGRSNVWNDFGLERKKVIDTLSDTEFMKLASGYPNHFVTMDEWLKTYKDLVDQDRMKEFMKKLSKVNQEIKKKGKVKAIGYDKGLTEAFNDTHDVSNQRRALMFSDDDDQYWKNKYKESPSKAWREYKKRVGYITLADFYRRFRSSDPIESQVVSSEPVVKQEPTRPPKKLKLTSMSGVVIEPKRERLTTSWAMGVIEGAEADNRVVKSEVPIYGQALEILKKRTKGIPKPKVVKAGVETRMTLRTIPKGRFDVW